MKNKLLLVLILVFVTSIAFGATKNIKQMVFGIEKSDFEALNITEEQREKIGQLIKNYSEELDKLDAKNKNLDVNAKVIETEITDQVLLQYKLYADFKKILTKEQLSQYEKAYFVKLAEQKLYLTKKFSAFEEPLELDDVQKDKYRYLINNFDGDLIKLEGDFVALLNTKQKIVYNHLKEKQMNTLIASGRTVDERTNNTGVNVNNNSNDNNNSNVQINNNNGNTEVKTDGKKIVINNNNNPGVVGAVVQPVLWWSIGAWCARPIWHHSWRIYDRYWDVYSREWHYWDGYWDGRWDEWWWERHWDAHDWDVFWDKYDFDYEQWRYEERIYDTGFADGIEYDRKLYDKWADEPFDEEKGEYIDSDQIPDYDPYKDIYEDAKLDYDLGQYYDEGSHGWNYDKVEEDWTEYEKQFGDESFVEQDEIAEPKEDFQEDVFDEPKEEPIVEPEHHEEPVVEPEHHEEPVEDNHNWGGNDDWGGNDNWGGGGDFGGGDFGGDFGGDW